MSSLSGISRSTKTSLTPEDKQAIAAISEKWDRVLMRTEPIEPDKIIPAIEALYRTAGRECKRVVIVPSPMIAAFVYGAATWIWHTRKEEAEAAPRHNTHLASVLAVARSRDLLASVRNTAYSAPVAVTLATEFTLRKAVADSGSFQELRLDQPVESAVQVGLNQATKGFLYHNSTKTAEPAFKPKDVGPHLTKTTFKPGSTVPHIPGIPKELHKAVPKNLSREIYNATFRAADYSVVQAISELVYIATKTANGGVTEHCLSGVRKAVLAAVELAVCQTKPGDERSEAIPESVHSPAAPPLLKQQGSPGSVESEAAAAVFDLTGKRGIECARSWQAAYQGGNTWVGSIAYVETMREVVDLDSSIFKEYIAWEDCAQHGNIRLLHDEFCIVSDFPAQIHRDEQGRPHNANGPSYEWRDGWKLYHIHGVRVTQQIVEAPQTLTVRQVDREENAEVRRVMIERLGAENYLAKSHTKPISRDDYGVLYKREVPLDETLVMVKILNSTPEPDGELSEEQAVEIFGRKAVQKRLDAMRLIGHPVEGLPRFKTYMLRVPPAMNSAHEAVAWTFGKTKQTYNPQIET